MTTSSSIPQHTVVLGSYTNTYPCYQSIEAGGTTITVPYLWSGKYETTKVFTKGYMAHAAWEISWAASDIATMYPTPPSLDSDQYIPTWVPGQSLTPPPEATHREHNPVAKENKFLQIGIPIIVIAAVAGCVWCCIAIKRADRREAPQRAQWRLDHRTSIFRSQNPTGTVHDPTSAIQDPTSTVQDPTSTVHNPTSNSPEGAPVGIVASGALR
ncbi:uncharacterized protein PGRI_060290 [Penicillium griseofulvum]|uniref:Uncharacterized protein n=1 Tax=Penicillium patulum TaxID=5078 RepID=A0A135LM51_PENPA|nr:uncharacterized protein PGRI_060290 [Penicillium griseofulvum]KXG50062.1 hypothetical protein PGRI_060290 [Penicillium griseofulvum]